MRLVLITLVFLVGCAQPKPDVSFSAELESEIQDSISEATGAQGATIPVLPQELSFCGEIVPMDRQDVREKLDNELLMTANWHTRTTLVLKRAERYFSVIEPILKRHGIPDDLKYLAVIESGLANVVSPRGAAGVWQFMKGTAKEYDLIVSRSIDQRYDLELSTEAACKYLKNSYKKLKNWPLVAASYNMGLSGISRRIKQQKQGSYFDLYLNSETRRYVFRILATKLILESPAEHGFQLSEADVYPTTNYQFDTLEAKRIKWIDYSIEAGKTYASLREHNPWIRRSTTVFSKTKTLVVRWPVD